MQGQFDLASRTVLAGTAYDALGDPLGFTTFPDTGNPQTSTSPLFTKFVWDGAQRMTDAYLPGGQRLVNTYDTGGQRTKATLYDPTGGLLSQTSLLYDTRGTMLQVHRPCGSRGFYPVRCELQPG